MKRIGYKLINEKKASVRAEKHGAHVEKSDMKGSMIYWIARPISHTIH
jgi:hypothetical protein